MGNPRKQAIVDAVVIGSGFGGSVSALRIAEAGKSVVLLERGKDYRTKKFPRDTTDVDSLLWRQSTKPESRGLYDLRFMSDVGVACAAGVGGGSLIYANIHVRPDASVFENSAWPLDVNAASLSPFYDKVASVLEVSPIPENITLPKRDIFKQCAGDLDVKTFDPDQAVNWDACQHCAECEFGCNHDAKNTLDKNYLQHALDAGAELLSESLATIIEPTFKGYYVHYRDLKNGNITKQIKTRTVVLAAGTLGTNELLLRNRDVYKTLGDISQCLGKGFSANGDFLGNMQQASRLSTPWKGPDVTTVMKFNVKDTFFTIATPTLSKGAHEVLSSMGQMSGKFLRFIGPMIWRFLPRLISWAMQKGFLSKPMKRPGPNAGPADQFTSLFATGHDNANGTMTLHRNKLDIEWNYYGENKVLVKRMIEGMKQVTAQYGGVFSPLVTWNMTEKPFTVHPLGGCAMSDSIKTGVVSSYGEVHDYPGLFISDGSIVPAAIGYHPSMTISALAERNAEAIIDSL